MTKKIELESLKGIYDRYPEDWSGWKKLIEIVDETAEEFGFRQIDPPTVERQELWTSKEDGDIIDEMYAFEDKGGSQVTLIPEQTPTRARLIQKRKDLNKPVKWYCTSKRWRYEDVTQGRDREFRQGDFDIFGIQSVEADAEVIAAAATIYQKLGVENRVKFKISDRQLIEGYLEEKGIPKVEEVMKVIDDEEKMTEAEFEEELEDLNLTKENVEEVKKLTEISGSFEQQLDELDSLTSNEMNDRIERMRDLKNALQAYDVLEVCELDLSIVRGLAYYTGLVFEAFDSEGELRALFGGGRYDELVGDFGNRDVPAVGFGFGYSTTVELLKQEGEWPLEDVETDVYVLNVSKSVREKALSYAKILREKGLCVETDLADRGFGDQLSYADKIDAERVLIVGERDLENGEVTMKHMETGEEEQISEDKVVEHLESEGFIDQ